MSSAAEETKDVEMVDAPPTLGSAIAVRPHSRSILRFLTCVQSQHSTHVFQS
jgi:hypothetical protein